GRDTLLFSRGRTYQRGVIPRQARERLGQLLQPSIVGKAPVMNHWIGTEDDFQTICRSAGAGCGNRSGSRSYALAGTLRVGNHAIVEYLPPARFKRLSFAPAATLPVGAHNSL